MHWRGISLGKMVAYVYVCEISQDFSSAKKFVHRESVTLKNDEYLSLSDLLRVWVCAVENVGFASGLLGLIYTYRSLKKKKKE